MGKSPDESDTTEEQDTAQVTPGPSHSHPTGVEVAEKIWDGSHGGHDPEAKPRPQRHLVRTYGQWANGRFYKCRRVLTKHPELVAKGGGNVNRLCAWLKDQWLGSTRWRKSRSIDLAMIAAKQASDKKKVKSGKKVTESDFDPTLSEETLPDWMPEDADEFFTELAGVLQAEMDKESSEGYEAGMERDMPNLILDNITPGDELDEDLEEVDPVEAFDEVTALLKQSALAGCPTCENSGPADLLESRSLEDLQALIRAALRDKYERPREHPSNLDGPVEMGGYCSIRATYPDSVVFEMSKGDKCLLLKQSYLFVDGEVSLIGKPAEVVVEYVPKDPPAIKTPAMLSPVIEGEGEGGDAGGSSSEEPPTAVAVADKSTDVKPEDEPPATPETADEPEASRDVAATPKGFRWAVIRDGERDHPVLLNKNQRVIRGPRKLLGAKLPAIPRTAVATAEAEADAKGKDVKGKISPFGECIRTNLKKGMSFPDARKACIAASATPKKNSSTPPPEPPPEESEESAVALEEGARSEETTVWEVSQSLDLVSIAESQTSSEKPTTPSGKKVDAIVRIIVPGPGNKADRFFYPASTIKQGIKVIAEGKKMFKDHLTPDQEKALSGRPRSMDDWAAVCEEAWTDSDGIGYGGITFVDEAFHQKAKKGHAHMGVSIRARAIAKPGIVEGEQYRVVESFVQGRSVDFVTEAGAGGGFMTIAESSREDGTMSKFEGTLDELIAARPDLMDEYRAQVESDLIEALAEGQPASTEETKTPDAEETSEAGVFTLTREQYEADLQKAATEAREAAIAEASALDGRRELLQTQRDLMDRLLGGSGLRKPSQDIIRAEYADKVFDATEGASSIEVFEAAVTESIKAKQEEIAAYLHRSPRVTGLGPTENAATDSVAESQQQEQPRAYSPDAEIDKFCAA